MKRGILVAVGIAVLTAVGATVARAIQYDGAAKPGVQVLGIDVGGKSRTEIEAAVAAWARRPVTIRAGGRSYHVPRGWLVSVDARATAARALATGSPVALVVPLHEQVAPVLARAGGAAEVLREIARAERPAVSAWVGLHGTDVAVMHAQIGRSLDRAALLELLAGDADTIDAPFTEVRPPILFPAARSAGSTVRVLLDHPVSLAYHGARVGSLTPSQLAHTLRIRPRKHRYAVAFDPESLARLVRPRVGRWIERARNAQFAVNGDRVRVVPSRPGNARNLLRRTG